MPTSPSQKRLRFERATVYPEPNEQCRVEVELTFSDRTIRASGQGSALGSEPLKAAALATIRAIQEVVNGRFDCRLTDLDHVTALGKNLIAVLIDFVFEGKDMQVFGSCQVSGSEVDAAVKATLNATNRLFELAMRH